MAERTVILPCSCKNEGQDELHGKGNRVHNTNKEGDAFCTVCSPSYRRNKHTTNTAPNPAFGHGTIMGRGGRNPKKVQP